jgi:hypothetical protein
MGLSVHKNNHVSNQLSSNVYITKLYLSRMQDYDNKLSPNLIVSIKLTAAFQYLKYNTGYGYH